MSAEWRVNHEHNGIEVSFPGKPPADVIAKLKQNGFRWASSSKVWYAKDLPYRREFLSTIAVRGEDVAASGKSFAEKFEEKQERAEARRERYEEYAESAQTESARRLNAAHSMAEAIPFGQPILVGHHSEGRDRRYRARIENNFEKSFEAQKKAQYLAGVASSAGSNLEGYDRPGFLTRRIKECEAELRTIERNRAHWQARKPLRDAYLAWRTAGNSQRTDPGFNWEWGYLLDSDYQGDKGDPWKNNTVELQSKLDFCKQRLEELGGTKYNRENVHKGDFVIGRFGMCHVLRVNPTGVTVTYMEASIRSMSPGKIEYERIKDVKTPDEMREIVQKQVAEKPDVNLPPELSALLTTPEQPKAAKVLPFPVKTIEEKPEPVQELEPAPTPEAAPVHKPIAQQIREALKNAFPGVKFSVRTSRGGSVNVDWIDGPASARVKPIAKQYERVSYDEHTQEILCGGNTFVFLHRETTPELKHKALSMAQERYGIPAVDDPAKLDYNDERYFHEVLSELDA